MAAALSAGLPWLMVSGNRIVNGASGAGTLLRGVNRSGLEYSSPDEAGFLTAAGITRREIEYLARAWKCNIIRLPFNQDWALRGRGPKPAGDYLNDIDQVILWCARNGMYTLLDLQWLNADRPFGRDNFVAPLPNGESIGLWRMLAERYREEPGVLFDLFNEPHDCLPDDPYLLCAPDGSVHTGRRVTMAEWKPWATVLVDTIRSIHPRALMFVSGVNWGFDLRGMPLDRPGLVYSTHVYRNKGDDWDGAFGDLSRYVPVFAGEWGCFEGDMEWGRRLAQYLSERGIGWTAWSWSDRPLLMEPYRPTPFGEIVFDELRNTGGLT